MTCIDSDDSASAVALLDPFRLVATEVRTLTTLARAYANLGTFQESVEVLKRAAQLDPKDQKVSRLLAKTLAALGRHTEEVVYRRRLALADNHAPAQAYIDLLKSLLRSTPKGRKPSTAELRLAQRRFEAAPDCTAELRVHFAELLYRFEANSSEARRLYESGSPCVSDERQTIAQIVSWSDWCSQNNLELRRSNEGGLPGRRPMAAALHDVLVFPGLDWIPVLAEGQKLLEGFPIGGPQYRSINADSPLLMYRGVRAELRFPRNLPRIETPGLLLGGCTDDAVNLLVHIGTLAIAEELGIGQGLPIVVNDDVTALQGAALTLLGYPPECWIRVAKGQPVCFAQLTVATRPMAGDHWLDPLVPNWYRRKLAPPPEAGRASRKIFVQSDGSPMASLGNDEAVRELASSFGFEALQMNALSVSERIAALGGATHVLGLTGTALTFTVFSPPNTQVVELRPARWRAPNGSTDLGVLATACGHRHQIIECAHREGRITAPIDALRATLASVS